MLDTLVFLFGHNQHASFKRNLKFYSSKISSFINCFWLTIKKWFLLMIRYIIYFMFVWPKRLDRPFSCIICILSLFGCSLRTCLGQNPATFSTVRLRLLCENERAQRQDLLLGARTIYLQKIWTPWEEAIMSDSSSKMSLLRPSWLWSLARKGLKSRKSQAMYFCIWSPTVSLFLLSLLIFGKLYIWKYGLFLVS